MSVTSIPMPGGLRRVGDVLRHGLGAPLIVLALLAMVVVPLPPVLLDALFSFNIAISLVVLLAVVSVKRPLDFAIFPIVLLMTTMLRLALNVASVRVILLNGQNGHCRVRRICGRRQLRGRAGRVCDFDHHQFRRHHQRGRAGVGSDRTLYSRCHARQADGD